MLTRIYSKSRMKSVDVEDDRIVAALVKDKAIAKDENGLYVATMEFVVVKSLVQLKSLRLDKNHALVISLALVIDLATQNALPEDIEGELADEAKRQHDAIKIVTEHLQSMQG